MKKILIVENHPDMGQFLQIQVELRGFAALTVENGKEAVEKAIAEKPDLIFMAIMLPEMDGRAATRILRANPKTKDIPILAATATDRSTDLQACIDAGCNDYIVKPFILDELVEKITALIR